MQKNALSLCHRAFFASMIKINFRKIKQKEEGNDGDFGLRFSFVRRRVVADGSCDRRLCDAAEKVKKKGHFTGKCPFVLELMAGLEPATC